MTKSFQFLSTLLLSHVFFAFSFATEKDFNAAIDLYSRAIDHETDAKKLAILYANRSFANLKVECFGFAFSDAQAAVKSDTAYIKAYYRRAAAQVAQGKFKQALSDYELVFKRCPNDEDAKTKFTECSKIVKRMAFEKAIAVDKEEKTLSELFRDLDSIGKL